MKAIIYDLDRPYDEMIRSKCDYALAADGKYAPCRGCFAPIIDSSRIICIITHCIESGVFFVLFCCVISPLAP